MADITKVVETIFKTVDKATAPMNAIAATASRVGSALASVMSPVTALVAGVASVSAIKGLAEMHSQAEGTRLAIAGTLKAFDAVGSFAEGVSVTRDAIRQINQDSAALPGSAQEYVDVFRSALPAAMGAGLGSVRDIANFTNQAAAIGIANQIDAQQVGRDTAAILRGHAGAQVRTWQILEPLIGKSSEEFNRMAAPERNRALQTALARYRPLLGEFSNTWDAVTGSVEATIREITMGSTAPLFDEAKKGLQAINEWLSRNSEAIARVGRNISTMIVGRIEAAVDAARELRAQISHGGLQAFLGGGAGGAAAVVAGVAARASLGPIGAVAVGALTAFATHVDALADVLGSLRNVASDVLSIFVGTNRVLSSFYTLVGDVLAGVLPPVIGLFSVISGELAIFWTRLTNVVSGIMTDLQPTFTRLGTAVGAVFSLMTSTVGPAFSFFGSAIMAVINYGIVPLTQTFAFFIDLMSSVLETLVRFVRTIGSIGERFGIHLGSMTGEVATNAHRTKNAFDSLIGTLRTNKGREEQQAAAERATQRTTPAARGGAKTVNDFRFSRFDVTQKFAEGFDPDRIAVAFASDLEALANQRLQSGLEPAFGLR